MPAGVYVKNNDAVQIDGGYYNLALLEKRVVSTSTGIVDESGNRAITLNVSATEPPMVAFRCERVCCVLESGLSGSNYFGNFLVGSGFGHVDVTFYIFGRPPAPGISGTGFQVFSGASDVVFDSNLKYARVVDMKIAGQYGTYTYDAGRIYAMAPSWFAGSVASYTADCHDGSGGGAVFPCPDYTLHEWRDYQGASMSSNTVTLGMVHSSEISPSPSPVIAAAYAYANSQYLILDVTNY